MDPATTTAKSNELWTEASWKRDALSASATPTTPGANSNTPASRGTRAIHRPLSCPANSFPAVLKATVHYTSIGQPGAAPKRAPATPNNKATSGCCR